MTTPPAATFILLSYNQQDTVVAAVQSVLDQDCDPIEILISDDASTDDSFARIKETVDAYSGPHHVTARCNPQNIGVNRHLDLAMELATSDLTIWAAGDDINMHNRGRSVIDAHRKTGALLIFSDARTVTERGVQGSQAYRRATLYHPHTLLDVARSFSLYLGATAAWHKDLFRKYGGLPKERAHEDLILGFRAALEDRFHYIEEELIVYREHGGVSSHLSRHGSKMENRARRCAILNGQYTVLNQRFADAQTFGFPPEAPIVREIVRLRDRMAMRLSYYEGGCMQYARQPLQLANALISEWLRDLRKS